MNLLARQLKGRRFPGRTAVDHLRRRPGPTVVGRSAHHDPVVKGIEQIALVEPEGSEGKNISIIEHNGVGRRKKHAIRHIAFILVHVGFCKKLLFGILPGSQVVAAGIIHVVSRQSLLVNQQIGAVLHFFDPGITGIDSRQKRAFQGDERTVIHFKQAVLPLVRMGIEESFSGIKLLNRGDFRIHRLRVRIRSRSRIRMFIGGRLGTCDPCQKQARKENSIY